MHRFFRSACTMSKDLTLRTVFQLFQLNWPFQGANFLNDKQCSLTFFQTVGTMSWDNIRTTTGLRNFVCRDLAAKKREGKKKGLSESKV